MRNPTRRDGEVIAFDGELATDEGLLYCVHRPSTLAVVPEFLRQAFYEARVRWLRHIQFRSRENRLAREAYAAMDPWDFEGINARQAWANWRTIPRNLATAAVSRGPVRAIDLCCGTGQSTAALAFHLPPGSSVLGLEYSPRLVSVARSRLYLTKDGAPAPVGFRTQSVLEAFEDEDGVPFAAGSVDLVNSSGAVGCHFEKDSTRLLAAEVGRVVRPGGTAMIDSGPSGTSSADVRELFEAQGFTLLGKARSCFLDHYLQLCFRKMDA